MGKTYWIKRIFSRFNWQARHFEFTRTRGRLLKTWGVWNSGSGSHNVPANLTQVTGHPRHPSKSRPRGFPSGMQVASISLCLVLCVCGTDYLLSGFCLKTQFSGCLGLAHSWGWPVSVPVPSPPTGQDPSVPHTRPVSRTYNQKLGHRLCRGLWRWRQGHCYEYRTRLEAGIRVNRSFPWIKAYIIEAEFCRSSFINFCKWPEGRHTKWHGKL